MCALNCAGIGELVELKGIPFPPDVRFTEVIVTGPPGSGKTTLIESLGGWPQEGYLDLARNCWWRDRSLAYRPREVHLGFPFVGHKTSHAVFDKEWRESPAPLELSRVRIPPDKLCALSRDWRRRYVFDFQLPDAEELHAVRARRRRIGSHPADADLRPELVERELEAYETLALHFHHCGVPVYVRRTWGGEPMRVVGSVSEVEMDMVAGASDLPGVAEISRQLV